MNPSNSVLLIDGYNVISPIAPPGRGSDHRWLERERDLLLNRLFQHLPHLVRQRTCLVFDAVNPPADRDNCYLVSGITVRFATDYPEADDLLEELIDGNATPKRLTLVSSDHRLQAAARRRSATVYDSEDWLDRLLEGQIGLAPGVFERLSEAKREGQGSDSGDFAEPKLSQPEIDQWMKEFDL
ncbi:NYN domain-containing protein [Rubripirellula sp.]|nr:NYN domain-containing protein [Rubripirellula sp.]MDB4338582.1 NYN domain-containing protein [Rubripirellula sp.]